jgi:hypothetical protein
MRFTLSLVFTFLLSVFFSQKGQLTGRVLDKSSKELMSYVTVSIHDVFDTTLVIGGITDNSGKFKLDGFDVGKSYLFKCSFIGYSTVFKNLDFNFNKSIHLSDIIISTGNQLLEDVEVIADQPLVTYEIDKKSC